MEFNRSIHSESSDSRSEKCNQDCSLANKILHNIENLYSEHEASFTHPINIIPTQSQFENVSFNNTSNVTVGNKTFYNGPVTINQFQVNSKTGDKDSSVGAENGSSSGLNSENFQNRKNENNPNPWFCTGRRKLLIFIAVFIVIIVVTLATTLSISNESDYSTENPEEGSGNNSSDDDPRIISRQGWYSKPPKYPLTNLNVPVAKVIISHTAGGNCFEKKDCIIRIQNIQDYHIENGFQDIGFNFLIGGDGFVYEGRGWNKRGEHTKNHNNQSIGLAFIGTFTDFAPQAKQINAAKYILKEGLEKKKLTPDYCLYAQMQLIATLSPGLPLYNLIQKWPHWCNTYT